GSLSPHPNAEIRTTDRSIGCFRATFFRSPKIGRCRLFGERAAPTYIVFHEKRMNMNVGTETPRMCSTRFRILDVLKERQGIETLRAQDLVGGGQAVVKALSASRMSARALERLEHEAHVLRNLKSPYVTPLLEFGRENGTVYLATSLVDGTT